jgi:hypothetical protein
MSEVVIPSDVQEHAIALLSAVLVKMGHIPAVDSKLVIGVCSDGLVFLSHVLNSAGTRQLNLIRVTAEDIRRVGSTVLMDFYLTNKEGKQSIEDFALTFKAGWNDSAGKPLN